MKLRKIAFQNLMAYRKHFIKLFCEFVALIFLITLFMAFSIAISDKQQKIKSEKVSSNYIYTDSIFSETTILEKIKWSEIFAVDGNDIISKMNLTSSCLNTNCLSVLIDDDRFNCIDYGEIQIYSDDDWDLFTENDLQESEATIQSESYNFLLGNFPQNTNEIVVSNNFLEWYRLDKNILGKTITVVSKYDKNEVLLEDLIVCGILTAEYCSLSGHHESLFSPTILVHSQNKILSEFNVKTKYIGNMSEWPCESTKSFFVNNNVLYAGIYNLQQVEFVGKIQIILRAIILYVATAILFALLISIIVSLIKLQEKMHDNSVMLLMIGLDRKQLTKTYIMEFSVVFAISFGVAVLFALCAFLGLSNLLSIAFGIGLMFSLGRFIIVFLISFLIVCLLSFIVILFFVQSFGKCI